MLSKFRPLLPAFLSLVVASGMTCYVWQKSLGIARATLQAEFDHATQETISRIEGRMGTYRDLLVATQSLFEISVPSRSEFSNFVSKLQITERYPGIQGVGFSKLIPAQTLAAHEAKIQSEGFSTYHVWPEGKRDFYTTILYLEPFKDRNLKAFGFDMYSEPTRRAAMDFAAKTKKPTISGRVRLVQEGGGPVQAGFLMYLPVFNKKIPSEVIGWIYAPFRATDLMSGILGRQHEDLLVEVFDGENLSADAQLYHSSPDFSDAETSNPRYVHSTKLLTGGRTWTIRIHSLQSFEKLLNTTDADFFALAGFGLSLTFSILVWSLTTSRARALELARIQTVELTDKKAMLQSVLSNIPNMVFVKDYKKGLSFTLLNKAGEKLLGVTEAEVVGKNDYDFFPSAQADFFTQTDKQVFVNAVPVHIEKEEIKTPSGIRYLKTDKVPTFCEDGSPDKLIGISSDITEELNLMKQLESERMKSIHNAKLASLGEISAGVAHEINNPLTIIDATLRSLQKAKDDTEKFREKTEMALRAVARITKIVAGLKKFARTPEHSIRKLEDASAIVTDALLFAEARIKRESVSLEISLQPCTRILCDAVEIEQVIVNLLNNAIDAIRNTTAPWIKIELFEEQQQVVLRVLDSADGIPAAVEEKIFQPFFTTKPVGEGTGLGLSISKEYLTNTAPRSR